MNTIWQPLGQLDGRRVIAVAAVAVCVCGALVAPSSADAIENASAAEFFERSVRPLLATHCQKCHGPEAEKSGLRLNTADRLFQGGHRGPVVVPGQPDESRLIQRVRAGGKLRMPPDEALAPEKIAILEQWIRDGAVWPDYPLQPQQVDDAPGQSTEFSDEQKAYWAFQPIQDRHPPDVADESWVTSEIDRFVLEKLEAAGLGPAPPADKRTLLRRVTFDLTGLPPTPEEINAFLADDSPRAFATVVDRLLESPHYGERWGRHWLDVARYGESAAHDGNNAYLHAWRYRDYVIQSFNEDKPYDRFIVEQLAGDLLPKADDPEQNFAQVVATGFLQVGPKPVVMRDKRQMLLDIVDEQLQATGVAFMGLTLSCARCHDHKFDPIPMADYYALAGILASTRVMSDHLPDSKWIEKEIPGPDGQPVKVMTVHDFTDPSDLRIHQRGSYRLLGAEVPRQFLQIIAGVDQAPLESKGSGRLEMARWIASADHPLTARVMVNRIWQHHFGRGIVATSDNFGVQGSRPTHPKLLDWLSGRFIESGWSVKAIHRLMLLSSTYQQANVESESASLSDPENELLWRMPRRRLGAEEIRDAMLAVSGRLDPTEGGTLFTEGYTANDPSRELFVVDISGKETYPPFEQPRRSVYLPVIRNGRPEVLQLFDVANSHEPTGVRSETTVAPQSLFLLNSPFARRQAEAFARRLADLESSLPARSPDARIDRGFEMALGRPPSEDELERVRQFLTRYESAADELDETTLLAGLAQFESDAAYEQMVRGHPQLVAYQRVRGIEFNGVDQRLELSASQALNRINKAFTVECWVKPADVRSYMMIVGRDGATERYWKLGVYGKEVAGGQQNVLFSQFFSEPLGGHRLSVEPPSVAPLNEWTHVALTYGNNRRRFYVNGRIVDDVEASGDIPTGNVPLTIGSRHDDSEWFRGAIDHVAMYNADVGQTAIDQHYRAFRQATGTGVSITELVTWRAFCQSLFCMNEFVYVD